MVATATGVVVCQLHFTGLSTLLVSCDSAIVLLLYCETVTPVVFETYGSAGKMTQELMDLARHQFSSNILQCEDKSAEQIFYSTWAQRISTAL